MSLPPVELTAKTLQLIYELLEDMAGSAFHHAYPDGDRWVEITTECGPNAPARTPGRAPGFTAAGEPYSCSLPGCVAPCQHGGQP